MKTPRQHWISFWFAPTLLSGGVLLGVWLLPGGNPAKPTAEWSGAVTVPTAPGPFGLSDKDQYQTEIVSMFATIRKEARTEREMPDLAALAAIFDAGGEDALRKAIDTLTPDQCFSVLQQVLSSSQTSSLCMEAPDYLLASLLKQDAAGQPEKIARWLLELGTHLPNPFEANELASQAIVAWGRTNPMAAADFAVALAPNVFDSPNPLSEICRSWAEKDYRGALAWAETLPDADARKVYALKGVYFSDNTHVDEAEACLQKLIGVNQAAPLLAIDVAGGLMNGHGSEGIHKAVQWALSLSGVPERREALKMVTDEWMRSSGGDWSQVLSWAAALPADDTRADVWITMLGYLEEFDPSGKPLESADEFLARATSNSNRVNDWLNSLPMGADRDKVIATRERDYSKRPMIWR